MNVMDFSIVVFRIEKHVNADSFSGDRNESDTVLWSFLTAF